MRAVGRLAAAAVLVATGLTACSGEGPDEGSVTRVDLTTGPDVESFDGCPPVSVPRLERQDIAFSGTLDIQGPDGVRWVFTVDHWYAGGGADLAVVTGSDVSIAYFSDTVHPGLVDPEEGGRYLVAGRGEAASACLTRPWSQRLADRYASAYADAAG
jgi:hypothetical protein